MKIIYFTYGSGPVCNNISLGNPGFVVFFFLEGNLQTHFELVLAHSAALCVCFFSVTGIVVLYLFVKRKQDGFWGCICCGLALCARATILVRRSSIYVHVCIYYTIW